MVIRVALIAVFFHFSLLVRCQVYDEKNFVQYAAKDGLTDNYITGLEQDSLGFMWIATHHGLNRFDGKNFRQLLHDEHTNSIVDNAIFSMKLMRGNRLGIATDGGAQVISTYTLEKTNLDFPTPEALRYWSHACKYVQSDQEGNYGLSTKTGFYILSRSGKLISRFDRFNEKDIGREWMSFGSYMHLLPDGNIMQQNSDGIKIFDRKKNVIDDATKYYPALESLIPSLKMIRMVFISRYELLVANTATNSFDILNIKTSQTVSSPGQFPLINEINWQTMFYPVNDSTWAFTSRNKGFLLLHIDRLSKKVTISSQRFFSNYTCTALHVDHAGRMWVGTSMGLFMEKSGTPLISSIEVAPTSESTAFNITALLVSPDQIFAGTDQQEVLIIDKQTHRITRRVKLKTPFNSPLMPRSIVQVDRDTIWIAAYGGLFWMNTLNYSTGLVIVPHPDGYPGYLWLFPDSRKNVWIAIASMNKVFRYNLIERRLDSISDPLLNVTLINSFAEDKNGDIWMGGDAMARWNSTQSKVDTLIERIPTQNNRKKGFTVMSDSKGNIWTTINDDGIASVIYSGNPVHARPNNFLQDNSLNVHPILINDRIYMATRTGVGFFNINDQRAVVFSEPDGLPPTSLTTFHFCEDPTDKSVWFATQNRICMIPARENQYRGTPPLFFTDIDLINDHSIPFPPASITLKYYQNDLNLHIGSVNFTDPQNMRFAYRFKNSGDSSWIDIGTQQDILLTNISPGQYRLQVKLYAYDNKWNEGISELEILVRPPFWKTSWFALAIAILFLGGIYFLYHRRIKQINQRANLDKLLAQTEMKALHTQMNPHFIFNCLNSIKTMILANENSKASRYLSKFAQLIRITLNQSSKSFVSLRHTVDYLERYLEMEQIRTNRFTYAISMAEDLNAEEIFIPPMLIQPFIENSIWHGELPEGEVMQISIGFTKKANDLICTVEDNGIGIEASLKKKEDKLNHHSLGIANIRQRIEVLNEKYNLHSTLSIQDKSYVASPNGTGTIAILRLPIKNTDT